jgi:NADH dehydrogenase
MDTELNAVTGAFGYTGKYITRQLQAQGTQVITLTGRTEQSSEFGGRVKVYPFNFDSPDRLAESLSGVTTLYNTYWVRFDHGQASFDRAVDNTRALILAAKQAGVKRMVHVSITNPSSDSPLPYFRGKAVLEQDIRESGLSYAIVRPTVIFGLEDILINNIAYLLRKFPVFAVPGSGEYRLQPIFVEDMAELCIQAGQARENCTIDAVGPEIFSFNELVGLIGERIGRRRSVWHVPPLLALGLSRLIGFWVQDVVLTRDEVAGLSSNLLVSDQPPTGRTRLGDWLRENAEAVGRRYASELGRHYR